MCRLSVSPPILVTYIPPSGGLFFVTVPTYLSPPMRQTGNLAVLRTRLPVGEEVEEVGCADGAAAVKRRLLKLVCSLAQNKSPGRCVSSRSGH